MNRLPVAYSIGTLYNKKEYAYRACGIRKNERDELVWVTEILATGTREQIFPREADRVSNAIGRPAPFFENIKRGQHVTFEQYVRVKAWVHWMTMDRIGEYLESGVIHE